MPTRPATTGGSRRRRGPASLLIAFLTGVILTTIAGVALLGFGIATVGDAEEALDVETTATPTADSTTTADPTATADATEAPAASPGDVPDPCVRASRHSLALSEAFDEIAVGVRDQDARTVQEALDAVQDAEAESEGGAEQCLDLAGEPRSTDES